MIPVKNTNKLLETMSFIPLPTKKRMKTGVKHEKNIGREIRTYILRLIGRGCSPHPPPGCAQRKCNALNVPS